jgi:hypothetical protein
MLLTMPVDVPAARKRGSFGDLSPERRKAVARRGAEVRWSKPQKPKVAKFAVCPRCGLEAPLVAPKSEASA